MEYSWLKEYKYTWEQEEKSDGHSEADCYLRPLLKQTVLIVDYSKCMLKSEVGPPKHMVLSDCTQQFIKTYFTYNPLSKLTLVVSKNSKAYIAEHQQFQPSASGEFSLKNALELALRTLTAKEPYWSREVLIVHSSLSTCDEGSVWETIERAKEMGVKVSVLSLQAKVYAFYQATVMTGGSFHIVRHMGKLMGAMERFSQSGNRAKYISQLPMSFPIANERQTPCACHFKFSSGYTCPVCRATVCSVPGECPICGYLLVTTPHLAKAKLSLMPLKEFRSEEGKCEACQQEGNLSCPECSAVYCGDCERFLRISLGKCLVCAL